MDRWTDRVVVVTGASTGIGRSIVTELSKYPLQIVVLARRIALLQVKSFLFSNLSKSYVYSEVFGIKTTLQSVFKSNIFYVK